MTTRKFGLITVAIQEKDALHEASVVINWSAVAPVSLTEAREFFTDFVNALQYAKEQEKRLGLPTGK